MEAAAPRRAAAAADRGANATAETTVSAGSDRDVTFCAVERVAGQIFVCVATTALQGWNIYRVGKFGAAPVQIAVNGAKDGGLITNVRFFRLFQLAPSSGGKAKTPPPRTGDIGALFVSERCREVSYQRSNSASDGLEVQRHVEDDDEAAMLDIDDGEAQEELTVFSLADERILKRLAPSPSLVLDVQFNRTTAAILCETNEILLYDLRTLELLRRVATAAPAMALGPRWLAYPGFVADRDRESMDGSLESDSEEVVPEALVGAKQYTGTKLESPAYTAIDVAQNVASGLYYLSEIGRATLAPYISSSPSATSSTASTSATPVGSYGYPSISPYGSASDSNGKILVAAKAKRQSTPPLASAASAYAGWATVQDTVNERVVGTFKCHSTALVALAFDFSGLLLATCSTKGQNLHVYRLLPPLQVTHGKRSDNHQLLYKLQRGITHASIQDIAFSQDSKWVNVTSAHGTSHLYAIHPEGARINSDTHVNVIGAPVHRASADAAALSRDVDDFYAEFRALETKSLSQVLKIRHSMASPVVPSSSAAAVLHSSMQSSPPLARGGAYLMESALDASQAFFSHLAQSTNLSMDFAYHAGDDNDVDARRKRRRRRISCLFAHDDSKMLICCDRTLKLLDLTVQSSADTNGVELQHQHQHVLTSAATSAAVGESCKSKSSSSSASVFGFDACVTELKSWELYARTRTASSSGDDAGDTATAAAGVAAHASICSKLNGKSELRTFAPRSLPLWAHPKVTFRAVDAEYPHGRVLEVKRKGPNQDASSGAGTGDDQMFVLEMDSYFGIGGSPVFDGQSECRVTPEVPPLDLRESINMAMATSVPSPPRALPIARLDTAAITQSATKKSKGSKKKSVRASAPLESEALSATAALQFTLQDMYFSLPKEKLS